MNAQGTIDYDPLLAMGRVWRTVFVRSLWVWVPVLGAYLLLALLVMPAQASISLAVGIAALYSLHLSSRVRKLRDGVWEEFAAANGWKLDLVNSPDVIIPPSVQFGYGQQWSPVIQAQFGGFFCDLLAYTCVTGQGRSQRTHNFTIACTSLPRTMPHMLLLSKKSRADVQRDLLDAETLKLEGDFEDYFSLQIEKGQEIDALEIITPDVMQALVQYGQAEDIEILGTNLYFILGRDDRDYKDMQVIIGSLAELTGVITRNIPGSA